MSFFARLSKRVQEADSLLCVGLDPHPADLTAPTVESAQDFCLRLIELTADLVAAFKPNIAFFEAFGPAGILALQRIISNIPNNIPVILDAKRGDIGSTAEAYAKAAFQVLGAHAVTINPYLGHDTIEPFLADPERGVFLLCKTSNPGAGDLQDLLLTEQPASLEKRAGYHLYEKVAILAQEWNIHDNLGLVVGATQPDALASVRRLTPDLWFLAPGVGVQGGDLSTALSAGLRIDGMGMLIPVSRGISRSPDPKKTAEDICEKINEQRREIHALSKRTVQKKESSKSSSEFTQLADGLLSAGCIKFGQFTLKSGMTSPIYIDLRQLVSFPKLLEQVAQAYLPILNKLSFDRMAGLPYAALPIATSISILGGWPFIYPRKEVKTYGTRAEIEGNYNEGERVVVIDDLTTTGGSKFESIEKLTSVGLKVEDIVVLIDRQSGAAEALSSAGYKLHSVTTLTNLLDYYKKNGKVSADQIEIARKFIKSSM
ncbi:MAG: orotidine-5'-phosphate decarboxylase [Anaerolineales bacterium]